VNQKLTGEQMLREAVHFADKRDFNSVILDIEHVRSVLLELTALRLQRDHWKAVAKGAIK